MLQPPWSKPSERLREAPEEVLEYDGMDNAVETVFEIADK